MRRVYVIALLFLAGSWWLTTPEARIAMAASGPQANKAEKPGWRKAAPPGVVELVGVLGIDSSLVALKDGALLSNDGRISSDGGMTWTPVAPAELANSYSPPRLVRIRKTGDLMCVWNQVSPEEIRRGFRRGRLSVAVSQDSGATWGHFKTLELSGGLEDVDRVTPGCMEMVIRARKDVGKLPDDYAFFHYANVCFAGDMVYIMYSRGGPFLGIAEQNLHKQEQVLRIYPLDWFYR